MEVCVAGGDIGDINLAGTMDDDGDEEKMNAT